MAERGASRNRTEASDHAARRLGEAHLGEPQSGSSPRDDANVAFQTVAVTLVERHDASFRGVDDVRSSRKLLPVLAGFAEIRRTRTARAGAGACGWPCSRAWSVSC